jgi:D-alanyl-D-alanine carboxypeptidase/D-alanyl-D-alanine-endopeptidase (penicillin-binding protein 4)
MITQEKAYMLKSNMRKRSSKGRWLDLSARLLNYNICLFLCLMTFAGGLNSTGYCDEVLNEELAAIIKAELPRNYAISIQVADLSSGSVLMEMNPDVPLIPASTMKVVTSASALHTMGPEFKFITEVRADRIKGQTVGNLYVRGKGDPYMVTEEVFKLTKALRERGLAEVKGDIVVDDSFFKPSRPVDEQEKLTLKSYHAPYSALSLNFNTVRLLVNPGPKPKARAQVELSPVSEYSSVKSSVITTKGKMRNGVSLTRQLLKGGGEIISARGSIGVKAEPKGIYVNVKSPSLYFGSVLKEMLLREGIRVSGKIKEGVAPTGLNKILDFESRPLALIVYWLNKFSNNFMAEQLSMAMGAQALHPPGTREKGLKVMEEFLLSCGAKPGTYRFIEASGLSRNNRLSASSLVRVLLRSANSFTYGPEFKASLGIAGVDGTLHDRFTDPSFKRRIRAKTGSLRGVTALAGYGVSPDGREFAFACLVNSLKDGAGYVYFADRIMKKVLGLRMGRPLW